MQQHSSNTAAANKGGYYTVNITTAGQSHPYIVYAQTDFHAARIVKHETGHMASQHDVEGPFAYF